MKTKEQIMELVKNSYRFEKLNDGELKKVVKMFYDLQGCYIELRERPQYKKGRGVYGNWPYSLAVNVFKIKKNEFHYRGGGYQLGDHASHKGIEHEGLDLVGEYYKIHYNVYLNDWRLFKELKITVRKFDCRYDGRYEKEPFKWRY